MRFRLRARNEAMEDSVVILAVALSSGHFYPHFIRTFGESEQYSFKFMALSPNKFVSTTIYMDL